LAVVFLMKSPVGLMKK